MNKAFTFCLGFVAGILFVVLSLAISFHPTQAADFETIGSDGFGAIYVGKYHKDAPMPCSPGDLHFGTFMKSVWRCENKWSFYSDTPGEDWRRYWAAKDKKEK